MKLFNKLITTIRIDNVDKSAVDNKITNTALDFKKDYLFVTYSVDTNLVTSLEVNPIYSATTLCHFGQTWNCSVAIHFILRGGFATSSATGNNVAVAKRFGQNEEPTGSNEERTEKKPSFVPRSGFTRCSIASDMESRFFHCLLCFFKSKLMNFGKISYEGKSLSFLFILLFNMLARE